MSDYLKHLLIRTPFERPLFAIRELGASHKARKRPELADVFLEGRRIEEGLRGIIKPDSNCIDVGCHLGSMLSLMIRLAPQGRHLAFEAVPQKAEWIKRKFPEVAVFNLALSDAPGEVPFFINAKRSGYSGLRSHMASDQMEEIRVPSDRLDRAVPDDYRPDFIKVDVEGAEMLVFSGATSLLDRHRPVVLFECAASGRAEYGVTSEAMYAYWTVDRAYQLYTIRGWLERHDPLTLESFDQAQVFPFKGFNFLAVPPDYPRG